MSEQQQSGIMPRLPLIDIARGFAILAMVAYHLCWDLSYFRFIAADVGYDPFWVAIARTILASFLFLVGVGLALGHRGAIRWAAFWRRWLFVLAGALAITIATWFLFPDSFVYFGVLHAIALFSLLALPLINASLWLVLAVAIAVIGLPFFYSDALFDQKIYSWLGFWQVPPPANDLVPVFPWFGLVLLGLVATRVLIIPNAERLAAIRPSGRFWHGLAWMGRKSLVIYLLHQPLLLALIYPASIILPRDASIRATDFLRSCQSTCEAGGTTAALCTTYCQCGLENVEANDLWDAIYSGILDAGQQAQLDASNRQCSALIYPELGTDPQ